jgi:hypothetical protein
VFLASALQKLTRAVMVVFYIALGGFIAYFPLGYVGEVVIYPMWEWAPLLERMAIKDSIPYLFVLAIMCAFLQMFDSFLSRWTGERQDPADAGANAAHVDSQG